MPACRELGIQKEAATVFAEISKSTLHGPKMQFIRLNLEDREAVPKFLRHLILTWCAT